MRRAAEFTRRFVPGLWAGVLLCIALVATPAPFAKNEWAMEPLFVTRNVTDPAFTVSLDISNFHSVSETVIPWAEAAVAVIASRARAVQRRRIS